MKDLKSTITRGRNNVKYGNITITIVIIIAVIIVIIVINNINSYIKLNNNIHIYNYVTFHFFYDDNASVK